MEKQCTSVAGPLLFVLCAITRMVGAQVGVPGTAATATTATDSATTSSSTVSHSRAYFNQTLGSSAIINNVLYLQNHFTFSFRTCGGGVLLSQTGQTGDNLQISLTSEGYLQLSWTADGTSDSLIIAHSSLSNNRWYTFDNLFLQGTITVSVEQGSLPALYSEVISNSTFRRYLWDLDLSGGPGITVGSPGFTGCFQEGLSVPLSAMDTVATAVAWDSCPLEDQIGCGDTPLNPCWQYPCLNGGTCDNLGNGQYSCTCPLTYGGSNCELDLGDQGCDLSPCMNGGTCEPRDTGSRLYSCQCPPGFASVNCEIELDECLSEPCQNGAVCTNLVNGFSCNCSNTGYEGSMCQSNIDECSTSSPCLNNASCVDTPGSYKCQCPPGYAGQDCENSVEECASNPCQHGGMCTDYVGYYQCECVTGYTGASCEINIDDCAGVTCPEAFSMCLDGVDSYQCVCRPGYTGLPGGCTDIDECASQPCMNSATCVNQENYYECSCVAGYTGVNCEVDIDDCQADPCLNGAICGDLVNGFDCECVPGYVGSTCATDYDDCSSTPCLNQATCVDGVNQYTCSCAAGWQGAHCDVDIDECGSSPCQNNAPCINLLNRYECNCLPGFTGDECEVNVDECDSVPCMNGGSCLDQVNGFTCNCTSDRMGTTCMELFDACSFAPCLNGGSCTSTAPSHEFMCDCLSGFTGDQCETNIDDCASHDCLSFQVCVDGIDQYTCQCPLGYEGATCDIDINECASSPCQNSGSCVDGVDGYTCQCPGAMVDLTRYTSNPLTVYQTGYSGVNCETSISECNYEPSICLNDGMCQETDSGFTCFCSNDGGSLFFTGVYCEKSIDNCNIVEDPPACHNDGLCSSIQNGFECQCAPGFEDTRCETNIDECASSPCLDNGSCLDGVNGYTCDCMPGLTGTHCEENIDECDSAPCLNNGLCVDAINEYSCDCTDTGFLGSYCEINIDDCDPSPCQHNSSCLDLIKDYSCNCFLGYSGKNCEVDVDECSSAPCQNSGSCYQLSDPSRPDFSYSTAAGFECACQPGFTGPVCETNVDECESGPCQFGTCVDGSNRFTCDCNPGYKGALCDVDIDECLEYSPCQNGAGCIDQVAGYKCTCLYEYNGITYGGVNCSVALIGCEVNQCQNGATCLPYLMNELTNTHNYTCNCAPGFTGFYCEVFTSMTLIGSSWLRYDDTNMQAFSDSHISWSFRTTLPSGLLLLSRSSAADAFIALFLEDDNKLIFKYKYLTINSEQEIMTDSGVKLSDAEWHNIELWIDDGVLQITLLHSDCPNGQCVKTDQFIANSGFILGPLYFGGTEMSRADLGITVPGFVGCIEDIRYDDVWVTPSAYVSSSADITEGCARVDQCEPDPCSGHGDCTDLWYQFECDCRRPYLGDDCSASYGAATFGYNFIPGWAEFTIPETLQDDLEQLVDISFFMQTRKPSSFVFYLGTDSAAEPDDLTYISALLVDGAFYVNEKKMNSDEQLYKFESSINIADGEQHYVNVTRNAELLSIQIDDEMRSISNLIELEDFHPTQFNLGYLPMVEESDGGRRRRREATGDGLIDIDVATVNNTSPLTAAPYEGATQDVRVNDEKLSVFSDNSSSTLESSASENVTDGVVSSDICLLKRPCQNNATCTNVVFSDYNCTCPEGFRGKDCDLLDFCLYASCPANATCQDLADGYECVSEATFNGISTSLQYTVPPALTNIDSFTISAKFRTRQLDSTLIHVRGDSNHYLTIGFKDAKLAIKDEDEFSAISMDLALDGTWQQMKITFSSGKINWEIMPLSVDMPKYVYERPLDMQITELFTASSTVLLGGVDETYREQYQTMFFTDNAYKGCLSEVRINDMLLPFFNASALGNESSPSQFELSSDTDLLIGCYGDPVCDTNACENNATCVDIFNAYQCSCVLGFNGSYCGNNIDDCVNDGCMNGAICNDDINSYTCDCIPGFTGTMCEEDIYECASNPCLNNATCDDLINDYFCNCSSSYTGRYCQLNITDNCDNEPCQNNGTCTQLDNTTQSTLEVSFNCTCQPGYEGVRCESEIDYCESSPCMNQATCRSITELQRYECDCLHGYTGENCETDIDECESAPCKNGATCIDKIGGYECNCSSGWEGSECEIDINECNQTSIDGKAPCENGICVNLNGSYECDCTGTGYSGDRCQHEIDECVDLEVAPCKNGASCENTNGSYYCNCTLGYEGMDCEVANCSYEQCLYGGTCTINDTLQQWSCHCPDFFEGERCQERGPCVDAPCENGGTCKQDNGGYTCDCVDGWTGTNCTEDIDECLTNPCVNGECINTEGGYMCNCSGTGFKGDTCDLEINECESQPCQNGGTCENKINEFKCNCSDTGFKGLTCETDIDECELDPALCENEGECLNTPGSFLCHCQPGFLGETCSFTNDCQPADVTQDDFCSDRGNCTYILNNEASNVTFYCDCDVGYTGLRCQSAVEKAEMVIILLVAIITALLVLVLGQNLNLVTDPEFVQLEAPNTFLIPLVVGVVAGVLIILIAVIAFIIHARKERATHGTYSPSRQEMSGSRVEMGHVMKPPPEERLI